MNDYRVLSVDNVSLTMLIDWGYGIYNHAIPLIILENANITQEEVNAAIEALRPPVPQPVVLPQVLTNLVVPPETVNNSATIPNETPV